MRGVIGSTSAIWRRETQQQVYRSVLHALSYPGRVCRLTEGDLPAPAWLAVLASLIDSSVALADLDDLIGEDLAALLQAPRCGAEDAQFIVGAGSTPPASGLAPRLGEPRRPDASATFVLLVEALEDQPGGGLRCVASGPGVNGETEFYAAGFSEAWLQRRAAWVAEFPLGVDMLLCDRARVVGLPRTTRVEVCR